jgi:hypothetical protein
MLKIKTLVMAAAVSTGVVLAAPALSQAMPASAPVKMNAVQNGNLVEVRHKKKWRRGYWRESRWRRHHHHHRYLGFYPYYYEPYYYEPYPYYGYWGPRYYRPRYYGPGIGFSFRF